MPTNTAGSAARQDPRQVVNTMKFDISYNTTGVSSGIKVGTLPLGAFITGVQVEVVTVFNAGTTNTLTVGTNSSSYNDMVAATDLPGNAGTSLSTGNTDVARGRGRSLCSAADKDVYVKYAQTGTAATTGRAVGVITFEGGWSS